MHFARFFVHASPALSVPQGDNPIAPSTTSDTYGDFKQFLYKLLTN